jgi:hypothetical protein
LVLPWRSGSKSRDSWIGAEILIDKVVMLAVKHDAKHDGFRPKRVAEA